MTDTAQVQQGGGRVRAYNEGLVVYLYDDSLYDAWKERGDVPKAFARSRGRREWATLFPAGDLLAYELRQDDEIRVDVLVRPSLTEEEMAAMRTLEPLRGFLRLPSGRLRVECANDFRFDPDHADAGIKGGAIIDVPPGTYDVDVHHVDMESLPADECYEYQGPMQIVTLSPATELRMLACRKVHLRYPRRKKARASAKTADTSWSGKYTVEGGVFRGIFVHNYDVSGPCINFDRNAQRALALQLGDRLAVEFDSALIGALFLDDNNWRKPEVDSFARIPNHTKCAFVIDREGIEKLMLFEFPDRDMKHFDFRKKPLFKTPVAIRKLAD
jgi:hypothetical protein